MSTRGRPFVPRTSIVTVLVADVANVRAQTIRRRCVYLALRSIVATRLPFTYTRALPRLGASTPTQPMVRPVNVTVAFAPAVELCLAEPPHQRSPLAFA